LCASGHHRGRPEGLAAPRAGHQAPGTKEDRASCTAFFEDLKRSRACYEAASPALAALLRDDFVQAYGRDLPAVVQCFVDDFEACIAHLRFPLRHRIPHAFGERPVLRLMYGAVIRSADRWRGITVGEFEQRQLRAIREELDRA